MKCFIFTNNGIDEKSEIEISKMRQPLKKDFIRFFIHPITNTRCFTGKLLAKNISEANQKFSKII